MEFIELQKARYRNPPKSSKIHKNLPNIRNCINYMYLIANLDNPSPVFFSTPDNARSIIFSSIDNFTPSIFVNIINSLYTANENVDF